MIGRLSSKAQRYEFQAKFESDRIWSIRYLVGQAPGRRWTLKRGGIVALVVQMWYIGRSTIAMDAMIAIKFWTCSKQSQKWDRRPVNSPHKCPVTRKMFPFDDVIMCKSQSLSVGDVSASLCLLCASKSVLWMMTVTTTLLPFGDHGDVWASTSMVLPPFCLLYATSCASTSCL